MAELLVKNGFKETYAIKGGVGGTKGWLVSFFPYLVVATFWVLSAITCLRLLSLGNSLRSTFCYNACAQ